MNIFKNEVLKEMREIETKILQKLSKKHLENNINYQNFSEKVNSILESNSLMIDSISNQKIHFEKINKLEIKTKEIDEKLTTNIIRLNNALDEIKKMRLNYDKIISENLIIPSYIGPGSSYKSIGEFIVNSIDEIKKFKDEKERIKKDNKELITKMDVISKNLSNFVEFNSTRCLAYTDSKEKEYQLKLDNKFKQLNEQSMETNKQIYANQIIFDEKLKDIGDKISKLSETNINLLINNKFDKIKKMEKEINDKLHKAIKEVNELKSMENELKEQMKSVNSKIEKLNQKTKLNVVHDKIDHDNFIKNKKSNKKNTIGNFFYNTNNNITNANEEKFKNNKNDLPSFSSIFNPLPQNNVSHNEKIKTFRNDKKPSLYNYFSKTEEGNNENKIQSINIEDKKLNENTFRKSTTNLIKRDIDNKDYEMNNLLTKEVNNMDKKIKEKIFQKSTNNLKLNIKKKYIFDSAKKDDNIERKKKKNIDLENLQKIIYQNTSPRMNKIEFNKQFENTNYEKELEIDKTNKKYLNILTQTINRDKSYKINKKELTNKIKNENNDIHFNTKNTQTSPVTEKIIDCNIVNLNLLELPKNENKNKNIISYKDFKQNSFELKNLNLKKSFKSMDSKTQIKISPVFGRTSYAFYSYRDT